MNFLLLSSCLLAIPGVFASSPEEDDKGELVEVKWWQHDRRLATSTMKFEMPEEMDMEFTTKTTKFHLRLQRNRILLSGDVRHVLHHADGRIEEGPMPTACFYQGEVLGDVRGSASISTCDGAFSGLVLAHNQAINIEPMKTRRLGQADVLANGEHHHVRIMDDEQFKDFIGDVASYTSIKMPNSTSGGRFLSSSAKKYVEVVAVNDFTRKTSFGSSSAQLKELAAHSVAVMNAVTTIYNTAPKDNAVFPYKIQVVLVAMHTMLTADPWESTVKKAGAETDCSSLLELFNTWGATQQAAGALTASDNRVLLSGRDFDGNTVGLAGVSAMCLPSRSGNVNMCLKKNSAGGCAGTVAHEMGHNFGMHHDGSGVNNAAKCPQSGLIMEAVGDSNPSTIFSSCSVANIKGFFTNSYDSNGKCLENLPTKVFGDPVCRNGFVEEGEDCDCGDKDCSSLDSCCDGATCKFKDSSYQCSGAAGPCCASCMFVSGSAKKVCRAALNTCDLPEQCPGGTANCPRDVFVYPGKACSVTAGAKSFSGLCASGQCMSLDHTCTVDITRDFDSTWDLTETCAAYNDGCGNLVCHKAAETTKAYECGQTFSTHGKQMPVPEGTPCWFSADPHGTRLGMCSSGACKQEFALAVVPKCGNGGIDFGEQCDCGSVADAACECATCKLKASKQCSASDDCCDNSGMFKAKGTVCRAAADAACDVEEVCSGASAICPSDVGKKWGTACTAADSIPSTCFGKRCLASLDKQCETTTTGSSGGVKKFALMTYAGDRAKAVSGKGTKNEMKHLCNALVCSPLCEKRTGDYGDAGIDPWICPSRGQYMSSSTFTVNGVSSKIWLGGAMDGTVLLDPTKLCLNSALVTPPSSCSSGEFLEISVGRCLKCDTSCTACAGPTNFDCTGSCKFGAKDTRGACAISYDQVKFSAAISGTTVAAATCAQATCAKGTKANSGAASTKCTGGPSTCDQGTCCEAGGGGGEVSGGGGGGEVSGGTTTATTAKPKPVKTVLKGSLGMTVPNATAFLTDTVAQEAVADGIASVVGVPASYVTLNVTIAGSRRLDAKQLESIAGGRHLTAGQKVKVAYTITMPPDATVTPAAAKSSLESKSVADITTAIQAKVSIAKGASFTVAVDSKTSITQTVEEVPEALGAAAPVVGSASGAYELCALGPATLLFIAALQKL